MKILCSHIQGKANDQFIVKYYTGILSIVFITFIIIVLITFFKTKHPYPA